MKFVIRLFLRFHVWVYRRSKGRIMGRIRRVPVMLLTTTGRKSGKIRTLPLGCFEDDQGNYFVVVSGGGSTRHPAWYLNLKANPHATVEIKDQKIAVTAYEAQGDERKRLYDKAITIEPGYGKYQEKLSREIPVVILNPTTQST